MVVSVNIRFFRRSARLALLMVCALTIIAQKTRSDPPPDSVVQKLKAVITERCPDAQYETTDQAFTAKYDTMQFTVHQRSKTGQWFPATRQEEGPNFRGFVLTVSVEKGKYDGPAGIPQTVGGPYFNTFIDGPPTEDGNHYWVTFSFGSRIDHELQNSIINAIPRTHLNQGATTVVDRDSWWLRVTTADKSYRVRPDGSEWMEVARIGPTGRREAPSPDGKRVVYTLAPEDESRRFDSEIFVADPDGSNFKRLTDNDAHDDAPNWTPDGKRIVFESDRGGQVQLCAMDTDGANVEQLTKEVEGARSPKFSPHGQLAYLAQRKRQGKVWYQDLIVRDGDKSRVLVKDALLYADYAWSPDGKTIAYGKIGGLVFHDLASGKETQIDFTQIDPQMKSHAAFNIAWRPDGQAVACSIMYFGGRQARGPKMMGDEEIFVIPRERRPTWFTIGALHDNPPQALSWVRQE